VIFRTLLAAQAKTVISAAALHVETTTREHFVRGAVDLQGELRAAGFPLRAADFRKGAAGLNREWDILIQSGTLAAAYGKDVPVFDPARKRWQVFVGFDDTAPGSPRGLSYGDVGSRYRSESVDMSSLLSWILDGTSRMVGRPVIVNGFFMAYAGLVAILASTGWSLVSRSGTPRLYGVSRGRRSSPITPT
jgi:hypothetical protein